MIEAGVGRRSAKPPRNTLSKTLAAALEARVGVGMSEVMALTNDDPTGQNSRFSRDFASGGLEELQQKRHNALVRLDLRAMSHAVQQLIARVRQCLQHLARAAVRHHAVAIAPHEQDRWSDVGQAEGVLE